MNNTRRTMLIAALVLAVVAIVVLKPRDENTGVTVPVAAVALPRLVDLGATRCIPCIKMAPILDELRSEFAGKFEVHFIDIWLNQEAGETYNLRVIPTQIFFDAEGRELFRHEGFYSRQQILGKWNELGYRFTSAGASPL